MSFEEYETSVYGGAPVECCRFWRGSDEWLMTSADREITLPGIGTFSPAAILVGGIEFEEQDDDRGIDIRIPRTHPMVAAFIPFHPPDRTWLKIYRAHRGAEDDPVCEYFGWCDGVTFEQGGSLAVLKCVSLFAGLSMRILNYAFTIQCNHALYGPRCGVSAATYSLSARIQAIDGSEITSMAFALQPPGWFNGGSIERSSGERRFIVGHESDRVTLMSPFHDLQVGETVTAYLGCDLTRANCLERFGNTDNFFGFEWVPWRDPHTKRVG